MSIHREDRSRFDLGLVLVRTDSTMRGESGIDNYGVAIQMIDLRGRGIHGRGPHSSTSHLDLSRFGN